MANSNNNTEILVSRATAGDSEALSVLMDRYRERLKRMVLLRLDRRLQGRVDASDVVQDALIDGVAAMTVFCRS